MFDYKTFLKAIKGKRGVTLIELLVVLGFIAFLVLALLLFLNPAAQIGKARDAKRKSDLSKFKNILEDYYNDRKCYPENLSVLVPDYLEKVPLDPATKQPYVYHREGCNKYWVYTKLEYEKDPVIAELGCQEGCGPGGGCGYNYGVHSLNVSLEKCSEGECAQGWWACQGISCNKYIEKPTCTGGGQPYCGDSGCGGGCSKLNCCTDCGGI